MLNNLLLCYSQVLLLRKQYGSRLNVFAPVIDLSALSKSGSATNSLLPRNKSDIAIFGGQMLGDKYSDHVVKVFFPHVLLMTYELTWIFSNRTEVVLSCVKGLFKYTRAPQFECYS